MQCAKNGVNEIQYSRLPAIDGLELYRSLSDTRCVSRHVHELFCLTIAESGVRICETKTGRDILTPGVIFISHYGEAHSSSVPAGCTYSCRSLRLNRELMQSMLLCLGNQNLDSLRFARPLIEDKDLYRKILHFHYAAGRQVSALEQESRLLDLFSELLLRHADSHASAGGLGAEKAPVRQICNYLKENYAENVSIEKLAALSGLSPYYCCRVFEKEVGVPPHVYQLDVRLIQAARLLARGNLIADVAAETGFFDQSHFHKAFRRKFDVTPGQYQGN